MSALALDGLGVRIGPVDVVRGVSATFESGALVAILGPNGAGKSSLLRAIAGLLPCTGMLTHDGAAIADLQATARARLISYLPQGHQTIWPLPVRDIVALGRFPHGATDPQRMSARDAEIVETAMRDCDVHALSHRAVTTLSGGEKARVALARVMAVEAPILLADEPTAALDPEQQLRILDRLKQTARAGTIVLVVTHDIDLAAHYADRILVMQHGRVRADGPPEAALSADILAEVFGLVALAPPGQAKWARL